MWLLGSLFSVTFHSRTSYPTHATSDKRQATQLGAKRVDDTYHDDVLEEIRAREVLDFQEQYSDNEEALQEEDDDQEDDERMDAEEAGEEERTSSSEESDGDDASADA